LHGDDTAKSKVLTMKVGEGERHRKCGRVGSPSS